jgi:hypothetical protein
MARAGAARSRSRKTRSFRSSFSGTHSITSSQAAASSNFGVHVMRPRAASASTAASLLRVTAPASP